MIQTNGKRDPIIQARVQKQQERNDALAKRPKKTIDKLTPQEREAAITAMLEWFANQEER